MPDPNTVSVEAGSTAVYGYLTQFVGFPGDTFNCAGLCVPVVEFVSTSELRLAYPWPAATVSDSSAWVLQPTSADWSSNVKVHKSVNDLIAKTEGGLPVAINAGGPIAKRALYDSAVEGFTFLEPPLTPDGRHTLYMKLSDETGDWSVGAPLQGGVGPAGKDGSNWKWDAQGPFSGRSAYDSRPVGFSYFSTDEAKVYVREGAVGNWSPGVDFPGAGLATKPEAVAGESNEVLMTPERVTEHYAARSGSGRYHLSAMAGAPSESIPLNVPAVVVDGFDAAGETPGTVYKPAIGVTPVHQMTFTDAEGHLFELADVRVSSRKAGILPGKSPEINEDRMTALLSYCEEVLETISTACDVKKASLDIDAGIYDINPVQTSPTNGGLRIVGRGQGHSVLRCPEGTALKVGDYGDRYAGGALPNFSHCWVEDLTLLGDIANIRTGSIGYYGGRVIRNCGLRNVQILGFDENIVLDDAWTFSIQNPHIHKAKTRLARWLTPNLGLMTGGRWDGGGCSEYAIQLLGMGISNDARSFVAQGVSVQESMKGAWELVDIGDAEIHTYMENNNQSDGAWPQILCRASTPAERAAQALRDNVAEGSARKMGQLVVSAYCSPGNATWTGNETVIRTTDGCMGFVDALVKTGSSAINRALETDAASGRLRGTMINMSANPLLLTGSDQIIEADWIKHDTAGTITERRRGVYRGGHFKPDFAKSLRLSGATGASTGNNPDVRTYHLTASGSPTTVTFSDVDKVDGAGPYTVYKTGSAGTLRLASSSGFTIVAGTGGTACEITGMMGGAEVTFDATAGLWIVTPLSGTWAVV